MQDAISQIKEYIIQRNEDITELDGNTNIIENRLIDSLQFVEFVMFIEAATGSEISIDNINIEDFQTLESIETAFCLK